MSQITHSTLVDYVYLGKHLKCHNIIFNGDGVINSNSELFKDITDILNINATTGNLHIITEKKRIRVFGQINAAKNITILSDKTGEFITSGNVDAKGNVTLKNVTQISAGRYISSCKNVDIKNSHIGSVIADDHIELTNVQQNTPGDFITGGAGLTARHSYIGKQVKAKGNIELRAVRQSFLGHVISQNGAVTLSENSLIGDAEAFKNITISNDSTVSSANSLSGKVITAEPGLWRNLLAMFGW